MASLWQAALDASHASNASATATWQRWQGLAPPPALVAPAPLAAPSLVSPGATAPAPALEAAIAPASVLAEATAPATPPAAVLPQTMEKKK